MRRSFKSNSGSLVPGDDVSTNRQTSSLLSCCSCLSAAATQNPLQKYKPPSGMRGQGLCLRGAEQVGGLASCGCFSERGRLHSCVQGENTGLAHDIDAL